jgi:mannose-1-phosphate guanylyltransferase/mannose-1-phosphate guanylyltransferase/mannose-6-phosphate isomerase
VSEETLLTETRRRAALAVPAHRTLVVVNRGHERFYTPLLADLRTRLVVAQPENRGTAPAILYALLALAARQAASDTHFVSDDAAFSGQIEEAFVGAARRPDLVTLLGIAPDRAEPGYGWIEPGEPVAGAPSHRSRPCWR